MADSKQKRPPLEKFTTPRGIAVWPKLNKPDEYKGKSTYNTKMIFPKEAVADLVAKLDAAADKAFEEAKAKLEEKVAGSKGADKGKAKAKLEKLTKADLPVKPVYDDDGNETDNVQLNFKMASSYERDGKKVALSPKFFDAKGQPIPANRVPDIWGGSVLKISGNIVPFDNPATDNAGVSLRLAAVQIIELRTKGSNNADDYGFGKEEDGYDASEGDENEGFGDETGGSSETDDGNTDF